MSKFSNVEPSVFRVSAEIYNYVVKEAKKIEIENKILRRCLETYIDSTMNGYRAKQCLEGMKNETDNN